MSTRSELEPESAPDPELEPESAPDPELELEPASRPILCHTIDAGSPEQ